MLPPEHWNNQTILAVILSHSDGSLGLTIQGGANFGQFSYLGELRQEKIRYNTNQQLEQDDVILEIQGEIVAGLTQKDVVVWLKYASRDATPVVLKCVRKGFLTKDLREYLAGGFQKASVDHELQNAIRDNLCLRTVPCTTREPRDGEVHGMDYWFLKEEEFRVLEDGGSLLESGFHGGHFYGTPKPPHEPLDENAEPIFELIRSRKRTRSSSDESKSIDFAKQWTVTNSQPSPHENRSQRSVLHQPTDQEATGVWSNITSQAAVAKLRHHDSGHDSEDEQPRTDAPQLPPGWEMVEEPAYGTYFIDHINQRTQYEHPGATYPDQPIQEPPSTYSSSTFPRLKKRPEVHVPKSATSNGLSLSHLPQILTEGSLKGHFLDVVLIKGSSGLGFTVIGGELEEEPGYIGPGSLLQLKSIAPGGPAHLDGRLRSGDVLVTINTHNVLGFSHDQVIQLFQSIRPGDQVKLRVCRGYPLPSDVTDPNCHVITTDAVSAARSPETSQSFVPVHINRRTEVDDHEVAAALGLATGPLYRMKITKGESGFGFTIAETIEGQIIKRIVDTKRCQGLIEGDLLVEINGCQVRGLDHTAVVDVLRDAPLDEPSGFVVQRQQRIEGRKERRTGQGRVFGRSKTPTAEMTRNHTETQPGPIQSRSKTPTADMAKNRSLETEPRSKPVTSRSTSSLFGLFRSKTPKTVPVSPPVVKVVMEAPPKVHQVRVPEQTVVLPVPQPPPPPPVRPQEPTEFMRNNAAYSSMSRMVTPSYIPASQYVRKLEEGPRSAPIRQSVPEFPEPLYAAANPLKKRLNGEPIAFNGESRLTRVAVDGRSFENASVVLEQVENIKERDDESLLHSSPGSIDLTVTLRRDENGFGLKILGGSEAGSQPYVGIVVPNGAAEHDGRILVGDEIITIDGVNMLRAQHMQVINMLRRSVNNGFVVLGIRRRISYAIPCSTPSPRQVIIHRLPDEGFGFVIISSIARNQQLSIAAPVSRNYPVLGRILPDTPAERCGGRLVVGDEILAVNGIDVLHRHHSEIVQMIKESGTSVTLTVVSVDNGVPDDGRSTIPARSQERLYEEYAQRELENAYGQRHVNGANKAEYHDIQLDRGTRGFGFSIRGGKEFRSMPLFVLRIAEEGPADIDGRLRVGDELMEVNGASTKDFTHAQTIEVINRGGPVVRLLIRRGGPVGEAFPQSPGGLYARNNQYIMGGAGEIYEPLSTYSNYSTYASLPSVRGIPGSSPGGSCGSVGS